MTLKQALDTQPPLHLSHNGKIRLALPFDDVLRYLGAHPHPEQIPVRETSDSWPVPHRFLRGGLADHEHTYFLGYGPDAFPSFYNKFLEDFFRLERGTFRVTFVEPGYGVRLDREGALWPLMERCANEQIPLYIDTVDLEGDREKRRYVVNAIGLEE